MTPDGGDSETAFPRLWLGQSTDTRLVTAAYPEMAAWPTLLSLGDAMRRPAQERIFRGAVAAKLGLAGPLLIDSGGFTLTRRPQPEWTPAKVKEIYRQLDADLLVSLDYPPTVHDHAEDRIRKIRDTAEAYRLISDGGARRAIVPVVHGRTLREVDYACSLISAGGFGGELVGIGGLVPLLQRSARDGSVHRFIAAALRLVAERFPRVGVHVFGAGSPQTLNAVFALGAASADSLAWRHAAAFGAIYLQGSAQRLVTWSDKTRARPRPMVGPGDFPLLSDCLCPICRGHGVEGRVRRLAERFANRAIHNAWTLHQEFTAWRQARNRSRALEQGLRMLSDSWRSAIESTARPEFGYSVGAPSGGDAPIRSAPATLKRGSRTSRAAPGKGLNAASATAPPG